VAVGGLLALLCDTCSAAATMRTARITVDILRPVPFRAIEARRQLVRDGGRVQIVEAQVLADGELLARASALRLRTSDSPPSDEPACDWPQPEAAGERPVVAGQTAGCPVETRLVRGSLGEIGPGAFWARANSDLIEGRETTPFARATMAADIASGPSSIVDGRYWSFANLDSSIYLSRPPVDAWIYAEAETVSAGDGTAVVHARLGDRRGWIGVASQVLFVAPRPPRGS
jgi:acyl-coenzyme A thioesterase PaaI-like protein